MRLATVALALLASVSFAADKFVTPPTLPNPNAPGFKILGPVLTQEVADTTGVISVPAGRFFAFTPLDGTPSYIAPNESFRVYTVKPGGTFIGIKYDAAADAEPETHEWPNEKGPVYVLLARNKPSMQAIQLVKNGPPETGPIANGAPVLVKIGTGPQPPPVLPTDFQTKLQDAFDNDKAAGATVVNAKKLASLYRGAATTTVQDAGLKTSGALFDEMGRAVKALNLPHGSMDRTVRLLVDAANGLPTASGPLDQTTRDKIAAAFVAMAQNLEGLK